MKKVWGVNPNARSAQQQEVAIIARNQVVALKLSIELSRLGYPNYAVEAPDPIAAAQREVRSHPAAIVVVLDGREVIVDVRELVSQAGPTKLLFLMPALPPSAALARLLHTHGAVLLPLQSSPMVLAATLVALLSRHAQGVT